MGRLGRLIGHGEEPPKPEASCGCPGVQKPPNSEEIDAGTGRLDRRQGLLLGQEVPRTTPRLPKAHFLPRFASDWTSPAAQDASSHLGSPLTLSEAHQDKGTNSHGLPSRDGNCWDLPTPSPAAPPSLGKQACSNLLILWRKHGCPRCCQQRSL